MSDLNQASEATQAIDQPIDNTKINQSETNAVSERPFEDLAQADMNIEALLEAFKGLLDDEDDIPEIAPKINALSEHIEAHFKQINAPQKQQNETAQPIEQTADSDEDASVESKDDTLARRWEQLSRNYRRKRRKYFEARNKDLQENLKKRQLLIESFKGLLNQEENITNTLKTFKALQQEWHEAGPIPNNEYERVWQTYRHHVENFYDYLNLNREFRDLDFKYNYDQKMRIIHQALNLATLEDQNLAFKELQKLHKIWKEDIGPVAKEHREPLWEKFSEITKIIHDKRQEFFKQKDRHQAENLSKKQAIIKRIQELADTTGNQHKNWQKAAKKVQKLRDEFFEIGAVPKKENKTLWAEFKETTRAFNQAKNAFFKDQKKSQMNNLRAKKELIALAEAHQMDEDFKKATPIMKKIQSDWRSIGPVPHRDSARIWARFKTACNTYFDRLHSLQKQESESELKALSTKKAIMDQMTGKNKAKFQSQEEVESIVVKWHEAGKLPVKQHKLADEFFDSIAKALEACGQTPDDAKLRSFELYTGGLAAQNQDTLLKQQGQLVDQNIKNLKAEINQLENNLGFFQNSKADNPLLSEVHQNIDKHKHKLELWQAKRQWLRNL